MHPFTGLATREDGAICVCCRSHPIGFIQDAPLEYHWNSEVMTRIRRQVLIGERPKECEPCFSLEDQGVESLRMRHIAGKIPEARINLYPNTPLLEVMPFEIPTMELKLNNLCNLKCRICGSWSSSTFATEELADLPPSEDRKSNHHYHMLKQGAWPRENPTFWTEIDKVADHIQYIEFTGGEPFMIKEHFDLLQGLVDRGLAGQIEIHYNTNGTQWPEHAEAIWKHFKTVEIAFSIDDVGDRFEYQRSNAVWSEVCDNIERFRQMRNRNPRIRLQVCTTVNVFNVYYIEQVANWINTQSFDFVYWNMMHEAYYFSISTLPESAKQSIATKLQSAQVDARTQHEFAQIIDFMMRGVSLDGNILRMRVADLDRKRNQNLTQVQPELAALINYA